MTKHRLLQSPSSGDSGAVTHTSQSRWAHLISPSCITGNEDDHDPERAGEWPDQIHWAPRGHAGSRLCGGQAGARRPFQSAPGMLHPSAAALAGSGVVTVLPVLGAELAERSQLLSLWALRSQCDGYRSPPTLCSHPSHLQLTSLPRVKLRLHTVIWSY